MLASAEDTVLFLGGMLVIATLVYLMHRSRRPDPKWQLFSMLLGSAIDANDRIRGDPDAGEPPEHSSAPADSSL